MLIYGLKNCDTCRKAIKALPDATRAALCGALDGAGGDADTFALAAALRSACAAPGCPPRHNP